MNADQASIDLVALKLAAMRLTDAVYETYVFSQNEHKKGKRCWLDKVFNKQEEGFRPITILDATT